MKVRVTIRLQEEDFNYLKSFFRAQGYNAGIRALLHKFVRICKAKEAGYAGSANIAPDESDYRDTADKQGT